MDQKQKEAVKNLIETGNLKEFKDIFLYVKKKHVFNELGGNYGTFRKQIAEPKQMTYDLTYRIAYILDVTPTQISALIHGQIDAPPIPKK